MRTYAARAPVNARVSASASVKSATNASAPLLTKDCSLFALLPTTRTFCLLASRVLAIIDPVLPVAPRMVYIKSPFKALCLDARLEDDAISSRPNFRPTRVTRKDLQENSLSVAGLLVLCHALREPVKVFRQSS